MGGWEEGAEGDALAAPAAARGACSGAKAAPWVAQAAVRSGKPKPSLGKPEPNICKILEMPPCFQLPLGHAEFIISPFNIIKGSLVTPESSWPYAPSQTFRLLQNPNHSKMTRITLESLSNHT